MNVKFYAVVNNDNKKILLANWCVNVETFERDIILYKSGMAAGATLRYKHGKIICESENGKIIDSCNF